MQIPASISYFKLTVGVVGLYAVVWLALEGAVVRELLLAGGLLGLALLYLLTRYFGGRTLPVGRAVALSAAGGLAFGLGLVLLTLFLMALKTGLHAHGPEYEPWEAIWLWRQLPVWGGVGALVGLGLGLLVAARGGDSTNADGAGRNG